jgi:probable HAF family extracellular repeat protein
MSTAVRSRSPFPTPANPAATAPRLYTLTDLGTHLDGMPLLPVALNERGEICVVTAGAHPNSVIRGFCVSGALRIPAGTATGHSPVTCLSNRGLLGGTVGQAPDALRAWSSHFGAFGERLWPDSASVVRGVNALGQVVGNVRFDAGEFALSRAFVFGPAGPARYLTPPQGGTTFATGLNDDGAVVFNAAPLGAPPGDTRAWCLRDECYDLIGGLGGGRIWAAAITPAGRVVGHATTENGETHAFLWEDGATRDLSALPGTMSQALAANDQRIVVGRAVDAHQGPRAFRWTPETGLTLLEEHVAAPHGWVLHEAVGINFDGTIVGTGTLHGQPRGFRLRPAR